MTTLIISCKKDDHTKMQPVSTIQFSTPVGNMQPPKASVLMQGMATINGGPEKGGYYKHVIAISDGWAHSRSGNPFAGSLQITSKSHAEHLIAGLQAAIDMGWLV